MSQCGIVCQFVAKFKQEETAEGLACDSDLSGGRRRRVGRRALRLDVDDVDAACLQSLQQPAQRRQVDFYSEGELMWLTNYLFNI